MGMLQQLAVVFLVCLALVDSLQAQRAKYSIISLGQVGESVSGGQAVSNNGQFGAGFSDQTGFLWETTIGTTILAAVPGRPFSIPQGVNDQGTVAGIGATTFFGSSPLPVIWKNGDSTLLKLPSGQSLGRAYAINNSGRVVGSVDGGSAERAATFGENEPGTVLEQTLPNGGVLRVAYGISPDGRIVGSGTDPDNAAVTKGWYLDPADRTATDIGALTSIGHNSAIAFGVSSNGMITGSSSFNSGVNGRAFLWNEDEGMIEIPLPPGASSAGGRGVNADGWVVGTAGGLSALPFLYDGTGTYLLGDLIPFGGQGWDLESGTSNGAFAIADDGTIFGRALLNGELTAFAMELRFLLGDANEDGVVDLLDVSPFIELLVSSAYNALIDTNCDGTNDLLDVQPFVDLLVGD